eukprot:TRINITY_DN1186_c0_g1_i1.p1 TRINITY_DN1186_c0_g1~~TRINITY_DN1186_c0_g1_i1.p1  ORF type:complete len:1240 (-),score=512.43 TRINITY_DN1186_c0_g1_i1:1313-4834(-)
MVETSVTEISQPMDVKEGDAFYALATFVSETGEAMNLVEGERVFVLEWNNVDWWYVRKHLTEETGWVPAQYLKDEETYTMYVQRKLVEKIEKLPVFEKPKGNEQAFAPKIIEKVKSQRAPDGAQIEFACKVEGYPRPQITWFRQTAIIKPSPDFQIYYDDNNIATLVIKEVFPEDAGTFTCVAKNCVGFASSSAELVVEHPLSDHGTEKHDRRSLSRESSLADIIEGIPPTFAQRPSVKDADEGTNVELECRFVAIPEAEVKWFFNQTEVQSTERISIQYQADMHMYCTFLKISKCMTSDAGIYEVVAKNREGEARNTMQLNVKSAKGEDAAAKPAEKKADPPLIVKALTPTVCKVGEMVKMETIITGNPKPKLKWYHNNKHFKTSKNINIKESEDIYTLTINKVDMKHDGNYIIKAENEGGVAQTSANLSVQTEEMVEFVSKLDDKEVKEQETVKLEVEVSADTTGIQWHKNGEVINEEEHKEIKFERVGKKHSLIIERATVHDEGEYVATVGDQECSCEVAVVELSPEFTKKISDLTVTRSEKACFEIEISKGDAKTRWFHAGSEIELNQRIKLHVDGKKQRLEIDNVELEDGGEYSCSLGDTFCSGKLIVEEPKVNFVAKLPSSTTGKFSQDVKITVELTSASCTVAWLRDGKTITETEKYSFQVDGAHRTLIIKNATLEDIAEYTCVAENVKTFTELELEGQEEKLEISELQKDVMMKKGDEAVFNIPFAKTMAKKADMQWSFNGTVLQSSERMTLNITKKSACLTIRHVEMSDSGKYLCNLKNSMSEVSVEFSLTVRDKPSPPKGPAKVEWRTQDTLQLEWSTPESDGGAKIEEYIVERKEVDKKSWRQIVTSSQTSIEVRGLKKEASYNFRIIARNCVGCSEPLVIEETFSASKANIPKSLPGMPNLSVKDVTSRSVTLEWTPPSDTGGVHLLGYIIEKRISTSESWERVETVESSCRLFTVENLKEVSGYYFRVSAENEVGSGKASETELVTLKAHASVPSPPTAPLEITPVGPHAIHVEWGAPESDGGAPLEGYKIAVRDAKRQMWMEVGRVAADVQRLKVQDLSEGNEYFVRIFAKNEVGFSDPLENEEAFKVVRPPDYTEEAEDQRSRREETPSLSFSNTETLSSWMREANMDADIQSYTKSSVLRREEYFFRLWYYASKLFK